VNPSSLDSAVTLLGEFLDEGAHLLGQSYGGVLCLLIAARWPDKVLSLAVNEPPAFQLAKDDADVKVLLERLAGVYPARPTDSPGEWIHRWGQAVNIEIDPAPRTADDERAIVGMMREQPPWQAAIDLERIDQAPFPKRSFRRLASAFNAVATSRARPTHDVSTSPARDTPSKAGCRFCASSGSQPIACATSPVAVHEATGDGIRPRHPRSGPATCLARASWATYRLHRRATTRRDWR
jgi:pimeloyl-ACP methyl ester carboxylesterase